MKTVKDLERCWSGLSDSLPSHSAKTTLLVDDSAQKAHLQPYNHLCVPEYTKNLRNQDMAQSKKERVARVAEQVQSIKLSSRPFTITKKYGCKAHSGFDTTLIAVIGVLDEIKEQTNVAGWIHAGGLWAGQDPPTYSMLVT